MNLRTKTFLLLTPLIVLPLLFVGGLGYDRLNKITKANTFSRTDRLIYNLKKHAINVSETAIANIELLSRDSRVIKYAATKDDSTRYNLLQFPLLKSFATYQAAYPDYYEIRIILPDGYESSRLTNNTTIKNTTDDESKSELYKFLIGSGKQINTAVLKNPDNDRFALYVFKSLVLFDGPLDSRSEKPTLRGYLVLTVDLGFIQMDIDNQQISDTGKLLIINNKNEIIFKSSGMDTFTKITPAALDNLQKHNDDEFKLITLFDKQSAYIKVTQFINNLSLLAIVPEQDVLAESHRLELITAIVIMITVIVSLTLIFIALDHFILSPIKKLSLKTIEIAKGQFNTAKEATARDEIGILVNSFSEMSKEVRQHREQLEEQVQQRTAKLTIANKELEDFAYSISHDLKAPLRAISGYAEILIEDYKAILDESGHNYLAEITESAERMGQMVDDLLFHTRLGRGEYTYQEVDLNAVVNVAIRNLSKDIKDTNAVIKVDHTLPIVSGHRSTLELLMQNLLSNAIKFVIPGTPPEIKIGVQETEVEFQLMVQDNGIGIEETQQKIIFNIFERLHSLEEYPGTGIGLAIAKKAADLHSSRLWLESKVGVGTTFYFSIYKNNRRKRLRSTTN